MDGSVNARVENLLKKLKARTYSDGKPKPAYIQNVATIRAELSRLESKGKEDK